MVEEYPQANVVTAARVDPDKRFSMSAGGIEIRREGKPVGNTALRGGSAYLVIDCSGSMDGRKIAQARTGASAFAVEALTKGYAVGLISFSSVAKHICEPRGGVSQLGGYLAALETGGSTNMGEGIRTATVKLKGKPVPLAMVVITDGMPDDERAALTAAEDAKHYGIDIITIGTDDADQSFLQEIASRDDLAVVVQNDQLGEGIASAAKMLTR